MAKSKLNTDRLRERMIAAGHDPEKGGQTWLAGQTGMSQQGVQSILAGSSSRPRLLREIAASLRTSEEYLLNETDDPAPRRETLVSTFDPDAPDEVTQDDRTDETPPPSPKGDIANLAIRGGLGLGSREGVETFDGGEIYSDHVNGFWSFPDVVKAGWRNMPQVYSIPVTGDSMEPTLTSGSYVFIDMTHVVPTPEDIYACDYGDGLTIKRLQMIPRSDKIMVMSDNDRYANYELRREDVRVYGRVVAWFQWRG
ncbi:MAG: hypothetical protein M9944_12775 [Rhizobiaceae bacterium]|nr:hypothetical protein [Rhizobiaceae bacterium]